jgi:hypothetical protein
LKSKFLRIEKQIILSLIFKGAIMSKMIIKIVDHDQKVFNMIDYGGDFEFFNDPRCDELMEHCERITSATNRHIEAFPGTVPPFSEDSLSSDLLFEGYHKSSLWLPTRRMRNVYLRGIEIPDNVINVFQKEGPVCPGNEDQLINDLGMHCFRYDCESPDWLENLMRQHVGSFKDDHHGIPKLVKAPQIYRVDIGMVHCDLSDPQGFEVFRDVWEIFERKIPIIIIIPKERYEFSSVVAAMRLGAENVVVEDDIPALKDAILDAPIIFHSF